MRLLSFLTLILFSQMLTAQIPRPVKWEASYEQITEAEYDITLTATIDPGWYVYSQFLKDGGPIPTALIFNEGSHFKLVGDPTEEGKKKEGYDELFSMDIVKFMNKATFTQKITVSDISKPITGEVEYMTCDDTKCLPPTSEKFTVTLISEQNTDAPEIKIDLGGESTPEVNMEEAAPQREYPVQWKGTLTKLNEEDFELELIAKIKDGWHIYSKDLDPTVGPFPTIISFDETKNIEPGTVEESSPKLIKEYDDVFGADVIKIKKEVTYKQVIKRLEDVPPSLSGIVDFMVCNQSQCLPPNPMKIRLDFDQLKVFTGADASDIADNFVAVDKAEDLAVIFGMNKPDLDNPVGECSQEAIIQESASIWNIFILGFLGGLVALLTPCIFPMIPLTVSFFTKGSNSEKGRKGGFFQASAYGFFILLIYLLLSVPFHLLDSIDSGILNAISTDPILNIVFFAIFVFFAFSFFGFYELTLPSSWSNKASGAESLGGLVGTFFMALTLALVSFSCTGPILGSLLAGALTADGGAWQLTAGMGGFGLALALPFSLFAAFPSWMTSLPRSGGWLNSVKVILGFVELALAFKFLSNADLVKHWGILKIEPFLFIWIAIAVAMGLYMFGKIKFPHDSPIKKLGVSRILLGSLFIGFGIYMATGFMHDEKANSYKPLKLLSGIAPPVCYSWFKPCDCPQNLNCFKDLKEGLAYAKERNQPVMIDFTGYACFNCRKMEEHVWPEEPVYQKLKDGYVLVSLYVDDRKQLPEDERIPIVDYLGNFDTLSTYGQKWTHLQFTYFNNVSQPYYVLLSPEGELLNTPVGYTPDKEEYASFLNCGLNTFEQLSSIPTKEDQLIGEISERED